MNKTSFLKREDLQGLSEKYPTPFYLYDEKKIRERVRALQAAFSWNEGFREYFAVKATPNPFILDILKEEGCGVDCSSAAELMMAEAVGFSGKEIMFSSNVTPAEDYRRAAALGGYINLDDFTDIAGLEEALGSLPETVCCRFNPGGEFRIQNRIMDNPGNAKYGFTEEQLFAGIRILRQKGVKRFGLHAFLASNTLSEDYYPALAELLFELAVRLHRETGAEISFVNLSGGVGIPYRPQEPENDIAAVGRRVREAYEQILVPAGMGTIRIFTELGRYILGPCGQLVTRVIHFKHTYKEYAGVDACAANLIRPAMYGAYHHITVPGKENLPADHRYDVTGGLCENNDKFAVDRDLPALEKGDFLVLHDAGAHGFSMGYNYNGRLRSAELLLKEDGSVRMIRRAERPADYFATFDFSSYFQKP